MILFWTSGLSIYLFLYIFKDKNADLRFIIFGSLFPVILDSILYFFGLSNQNEYIGHSIFFTVSLFFIFGIICIFSLTSLHEKTISSLVIPLAVLVSYHLFFVRQSLAKILFFLLIGLAIAYPWIPLINSVL